MLGLEKGQLVEGSSKMRKKLQGKTHAVHTGEKPDEQGSISPPLVMATSFKIHPDEVGFSANDYGEDAPFFYGRWSNPTVRRLEEKLAALEGGEDAVCFGSGMGAISGLFYHLLQAGDHLVLPNICYAAVLESAHEILPRFGIEVSLVDTSDIEAVQTALRPNSKLVHLETPCNPTTRLADLRAISELAHKAGAKVSVDATFASPIGQPNFELGADFVIHSLTKYACGHGDAMGGVVIGARADMDALRKDTLVHFGAVMSPFDAWIVGRSLHSLHARMAQHQSNALAVAAFLEKHPRVERVYYPGLDSHPQHDLAKSQMKNFGGMLAFRAKESAQLANQLAESVQVFTYAVSLGKSKSLIFYIPTEDIQASSLRMNEAELARYRDWAGDGLLRVSIGIEGQEDLLADLEEALA